MKKKVAEQAEMWGWEWGGWDTKLRKQPNSNYFPICPLHSSVGTMHLWSIVTKAQQDSNWFVTMCRKGVFLAISPTWSHHKKDLSQYYKIEFFPVPFSSRLVIFSTQKCVGVSEGRGDTTHRLSFRATPWPTDNDQRPSRQENDKSIECLQTSGPRARVLKSCIKFVKRDRPCPCCKKVEQVNIHFTN